jgi:uncharacterized protein YndB with AHSA1/START domain
MTSTVIHHEVWVNASPRVVFDALTTQAGLDAWWGTCLSAEPVVGHLVEFDHHLGAPLTMRITELVPVEHVAWRCTSEFTDSSNPASDWLGTSLVFDLRPADDDPALDWMGARLGIDPGAIGASTILEFRHLDWPHGARWHAFCNSAWGGALGALAKSCEE